MRDELPTLCKLAWTKQNESLTPEMVVVCFARQPLQEVLELNSATLLLSSPKEDECPALYLQLQRSCWSLTVYTSAWRLPFSSRVSDCSVVPMAPLSHASSIQCFVAACVCVALVHRRWRWSSFHGRRGTEPTDVSSQKMRCSASGLRSVDFETCHKCVHWTPCGGVCSSRTTCWVFVW